MNYAQIKSLIVLLLLLVASCVFCWRVYQLLWVNLRRGQPGGSYSNWGERIKSLFVYVGGQKDFSGCLYRVLHISLYSGASSCSFQPYSRLFWKDCWLLLYPTMHCLGLGSLVHWHWFKILLRSSYYLRLCMARTCAW